MIYNPKIVHLDNLYYTNLGEDSSSLIESAPRILGDYRRVLSDYVQILKKKSLLVKFVLEKSLPPARNFSFEDNFPVRIKISPKIEAKDREYARKILSQVLNWDIKKLRYIDPSDKKTKNVKVVETFSDEEILILDSKPNYEIEYFPYLNDLSITKEISAIEKLMDRPNKSHIPLLRLAGRKTDDKWIRPDLVKVKQWKVLINDDFPGVKEQRSMVEKALSTNDFAILEGPPGSGKTTVITEIILQLLSQNKKVLLVGSTHVAVDNVLEKVIEYKDIVVPIRIAPLDQDLSPDVMKLTYGEYSRTFKKRLLANLNAIQNRSELQEEMIRELQTGKDDNFIINIINDSINLVCGTNIGVLQYPEIRDSLWKKSFNPLFDVMILDEASKTNFLEFLTPAMFAWKWVISGDPKQLSPYTDRDFIEEQIESLLRKEYNINESTKDYEDLQKVVFKSYWAERVFTKNDEKRSVLLLLSKDDWRLRNRIAKQLEALKKNTVIHVISDDIKNGELLERIKISGSDIVIGNEKNIINYSNSLPYGIIVPDNFWRNSTMINRNNFFKNANSLKQFNSQPIKISSIGDKSLSEELAWRLIRSYEMRNSAMKATQYNFEISELLLNLNDNYKIIDRLNNIKYSSLPSIIDILISGNSKINPNYRESVLESGFTKEYRTSIWTMLSYQYRMHPEISYFPRKLVYTSDDGNDIALKDSTMISRQWNYKRYYKRVIWLQVSNARDFNRDNERPNLNRKEISKIIGELEHFIKFASSTRNPSYHHWTVAILSFYKPQTRELKKEMQKIFGGGGPIYFTADRSARIFVGNVDSMQGREADIVFLSMVRTGGLGFLDNTNRLNVAITRSRYQLVMVGDNNVFTRKRYKDTLIFKLASQIKTDYDFSSGV